MLLIFSEIKEFLSLRNVKLTYRDRKKLERLGYSL